MPRTMDYEPVFPWVAPFLFGMAGANFLFSSFATSAVGSWKPSAWPGQIFSWAGRHSLAIYLIHQPILFALFFAGTQLSGEAARHDRERYIAACRPACVESGGEIEACAQACECVAAAAEKTGLLASLTSHSVSNENRARVRGIVGTCSSDAR